MSPCSRIRRSRSVIDSRLIDLTSYVAQSERERRIREQEKPKIHYREDYVLP